MPIYVGVSALNDSSGVRARAELLVNPSVLDAITASGAGATLTANTYFYVVTSVGDSGETVVSNEESVAVTLGESAILTWDAVPGAASYRVYRGTTSGTYTAHFVANGNGFTDAGQASAAGPHVPPATGIVLNDPAEVRLTTDSIAVVDVEDSKVRKSLASHGSIGQWIVVATNDKVKLDGLNLTALTSNSA